MLFATRKMYEVVPAEAYDNALKTFLEHLYPQNPPIENKIDFLLEKFSALPDIIEPQRLKDFTLARPVTASRFVMTQQDFVRFLESFYFLLTSKDEFFKTTPQQKVAIREGLREVYTGQICEPGIVTRLNSIFLQCRSDLQWISIELLKQRLNKIQLMADRYNQKFNIADGYAVHTVNCMQQLAEKFELGVKLKLTIDDVYMHTHQIQLIEDYFKNNYLEHFETYQTECIDGLTSHLWSIFTTEYKPRLKMTQDNKVEITRENTKTLNEFLRNYLFDEEDLSLQIFVDEDEFVLKPDDELKQAIKIALIDKLQKDNFLIATAQLSPENIAQVYFIENRDKKSQRLKAFIKDFSNQTLFMEQISSNLIKHNDFILEYPEFIVDFLLQNPSLWDSLPRQLRQNHDFILFLIKSIKSQGLDQAQQANIRLQNEKLFEGLKNYWGDDPKKTRIFLDGSFKEAFLSTPLNLQIYQKILLQNREYSEFFEVNFPLVLFNKLKLPSVTEVKSIFQLRQIAHNISSAEIRKLDGLSVQGLSPTAVCRFKTQLDGLQLYWSANEYLQLKKRLPALTGRNQFSMNSQEYDQSLLLEALHMHNNCIDALLYFQHHTGVLDLEYCPTYNFQNQLQFTWELLLSWADTQLNILKLIAELAKTIAIWLVFFELGQYVDLLSIMIVTFPWLNLVLCILGNFSAYSLMNEVFRNELKLEDIYYCAAIEILVMLIIPALITKLSLILVVLQILPHCIAKFCQLLNLNWSLQDIKLLITTYMIMYLLSDNYMVEGVCNIAKKMYLAIADSLTLIWAIFTPFIVRGFLNLPQLFHRYTFEQTSLDIENQILRLELSGTISGQQKADILSQLWGHVLVDVQQNGILSIREALDKPHVFNFKCQDYTMSFRQVAAIKRQKYVELQLDGSQTQRFSWFRTTTDQVLCAVPTNLKMAT